jgi:tetratricopeptide (TPR) repeat protein
MTTWFKLRMPEIGGRFLDRLMLRLAALLVIAAAAFAGYYYWDHYLNRQGTAGTGSTERQIAGYEQAVRTNPDDAAARLALAQLYFANHRFADSVQQYQAVLTLDDKSTVALVGLGQALAATGDQAGAIGSFQKVIDQAKDADISSNAVESAHYYLGSIALDQQRPSEAITELQGALAIERTDSDAWYLLGAAYIDNGNPDQAIAALSQAVLFVPNFADAYEKLAVAYEEKGLAAEGQYARGMLAYSKGQYSDALSKLQAAVTASPDFAVAHVGLGLTHEMRSERDLAIASYQRALQLEPNNFTAQSALARLGAASTPTSGQQQGVTP